MSGAAELRVYRAQLISVAGGYVGALVFFLIGLSMVASPRLSGGVSGVVVGAFVLLLSLWLAAVLATNRLIVTPAGLVHWNYLRHRSVGWAEVKSFDVGPSRTPMRWPGLVIRRNDGSVLATNVVAFTRRYPARIADELAAWQRQLAPAALPGGDLPQGESSGSAAPS
jgi:hypothetical protein